MRTFLQGLLNSGQVTVPPLGVSFDPAAECMDLLLQFDQAARLELPDHAPELDPAVAQWAALMLAEVSRLVIARDAGPEVIEAVFSKGCEAEASSSADYSADLFFCYLPNLAKIIQRLAPGDPLYVRLQELAGTWPLSSVAMDLPPPDAVRLETVLSSPCLRRLYVDRVIASKQTQLLENPTVYAAVKETLGHYPGLAPEISIALAGALTKDIG